VTKVGIDTFAVYTSRYVLDLATLAKARGIDPDKYTVGLGQQAMSVPPPGEDIVTMAANAAKQALQGINLNDIEMLLFATESGIDQSKAAGIYVHDLLGLPSRCRVVELKQACYAGTAGLQFALPFLRENPTKKVLLIASDIARYGLNTPGESSQGCGAVAIVLSANPRVLAFEREYGVVTENVMDFWRPNYLHEALVEGKYSSKLYLSMLEKSWVQYCELSGRHFEDHDYFCYHTPVPRLVEKAHHSLLKMNNRSEVPEEVWIQQVNHSLDYGRKMGNSYTAALYIGLASLLDSVKDDLADKRIGFYSYGSGCVAEYFSGVVQPGYRDALHTQYHTDMLTTRTPLTYDEYAGFYSFSYPEDGSNQDVPTYNTRSFRLARMQSHKRIYEVVNPQPIIAAVTVKKTVKNNEPRRDDGAEISKDYVMRVYAPGKLILSGEHAVVYGGPALAMAINRHAIATVTREQLPQILFDLSDLAHRSRLSFSGLHDLKSRIKRKYHRFVNGDFSIREVLQKPFELAQVALGIFAESLNISMPHGVKIHVQSDIPIGCGMGSSAATIVSVMHAVSNYLQAPISSDTLYQLALEAENMQHGRSSGLDLRVAMQGGCLYMHGQEMQTRSVPSMPMYLVNTGTPVSSTGQCVEKVAGRFKSPQLGDDFAAVTNAMDAALQAQSWANMQQAIRDNHRLLVNIGVVPEKVQQFIATIEASGGAAKVCGAGAVMGDYAGAVLVAAEDKTAVSLLSSRFGYNVIPISGESRGVHAA